MREFDNGFYADNNDGMRFSFDSMIDDASGGNTSWLDSPDAEPLRELFAEMKKRSNHLDAMDLIGMIIYNGTDNYDFHPFDEDPPLDACLHRRNPDGGETHIIYDLNEEDEVTAIAVTYDEHKQVVSTIETSITGEDDITKFYQQTITN